MMSDAICLMQDVRDQIPFFLEFRYKIQSDHLTKDLSNVIRKMAEDETICDITLPLKGLGSIWTHGMAWR